MVERYKSPFPLPTPHEREILIILIEECAEVQQRVTKALRFGLDEHYDLADTNKDLLSREIGQLRYMINRCGQLGLLNRSQMIRGFDEKHVKMKKYLQTDPD